MNGTTNEGITHGAVEWVDLSTPDVEAAKRFYAGLLGWSFDTQRTEMGEYVVAAASGREVAGMMAPPPDAAGAPSMWTTFVRVDALEPTLARVADAGGVVRTEPFEIPGGARIAVLSDTTGAMLALIAGGPPAEESYFSDDHGAVCWVELMTRSVDGATEFYRRVLGWTSETDSSGPVPYTVCRSDGRETAGIIGRSDNVPAEAPDSWSVYFAVDDCARALERAVQLGGAVLLPATPTPMGPFAVLADPMGAAFQVMQIDAPDAATNE